MNCHVGSVARCGRAITVTQRVDPTALARAVREGPVERDGRPIRVDAPSPAPVHEHVGCIRPGMGLRRETALARAARSRGLSTPYDDEIAALRSELAEFDVTESALADYRRAAANAATDRDRLREEVAAARGRLEATREAGKGTASAAAALEDAIRRLSEAETAAAAARERLEEARAARRQRRDRRDRRFRLEDRLANRQRDARRSLADAVRERYHDAFAVVPGSTPDEPGAADPMTAALAIARIADLTAPVVLACDRFSGAEAAREWLDAPVLKVQVR